MKTLDAFVVVVLFFVLLLLFFFVVFLLIFTYNKDCRYTLERSH